jgi:aryl-phospho-beta-D-glucosidase BglC (GH1 family)
MVYDGGWNSSHFVPAPSDIMLVQPWITPSMFDNTGNDAIIDEYTFGQYQDYNTASSALQQHWATWYTEDDFVQIAAAGLNHAR